MAYVYAIYSQERCTRTILLAYFGSVLLCIPSFITFGIEQQQVMINGDANHTLPSLLSSPGAPSSAQPLVPHHDAPNWAVIYTVDLNPIAKKHDDLIHKVSRAPRSLEPLTLSTDVRNECSIARRPVLRKQRSSRQLILGALGPLRTLHRSRCSPVV